MARDKNKKFPPRDPAAPAPEAPKQKEVKGERQDLVKVHYKGKNHHVLDHVHAVSPGVNHLPKPVWEKVKGTPAVAKLLADGVLIDLSEAVDEAPAPAASAESDAGSDETDADAEGDESEEE